MPAHENRGGMASKIEAWIEARKRRMSPPAEPGTATAHESWHARGKAVKMTPGRFVNTQTARLIFLFYFIFVLKILLAESLPLLSFAVNVGRARANNFTYGA